MKTKTGLTTHDIRKSFGWTQEEMSIQWGIPLATIRNWDTRHCMPEYVQTMATEIRRSWDTILRYEVKKQR